MSRPNDGDRLPHTPEAKPDDSVKKAHVDLSNPKDAVPLPGTADKIAKNESVQQLEPKSSSIYPADKNCWDPRTWTADASTEQKQDTSDKGKDTGDKGKKELSEEDKKKVDALVDKFGKDLSEKERKELKEALTAVFSGDKKGMEELLRLDGKTMAALTKGLESLGFKVTDDHETLGPPGEMLTGWRGHHRDIEITPPGCNGGIHISERDDNVGSPGPVFVDVTTDGPDKDKVLEKTRQALAKMDDPSGGTGGFIPPFVLDDIHSGQDAAALHNALSDSLAPGLDPKVQDACDKANKDGVAQQTYDKLSAEDKAKVHLEYKGDPPKAVLVPGTPFHHGGVPIKPLET